jgi:hypothetical protein
VTHVQKREWNTAFKDHLSEIKQIKQVDDALEQPEVRDELEPLENGNG